jgi:hypothetical protein
MTDAKVTSLHADRFRKDLRTAITTVLASEPAHRRMVERISATFDAVPNETFHNLGTLNALLEGKVLYVAKRYFT